MFIDELHSCTPQILKVIDSDASLNQVIKFRHCPLENKLQEIHVAIILSKLLHAFQ
jgi:hypothetical protein